MHTLALVELTELGLFIKINILMLSINSSEFHVLTVEHGWVVGNREGGDKDEFMCEQLRLLYLPRGREKGAYLGGGGKDDPV